MKVKITIRAYGLSFLMIILFISGCSLFFQKHTKEVVQNRISEAEEHFQVVKSLDMEELDGEAFETAKSSLATAKEHLKIRRRDQAFEFATQSLETSKQILRKFYLNTVVELARKAKKELAAKVGEDPDDPLTDYVPKLDGVLDRAAELEADQQVISLDKVLEDLKEVLKVTCSIQTSTAETLESDVSFDRGSYDLADRGKQALETAFEKVMAEKEAYVVSNPDKTVILKVKVVGYTDLLNFNAKSPLVAELSKDVSDIPPRDPERRKFLNQRLSELRAKTITQYIRESILKEELENPSLDIQIETVGRGEKIPANTHPPYPTSDPRRRICKIYTYTTVY